MRSVLLWNWQVSQRATIHGQYLFHLTAFWNSFLGALPPVVSLSFLWDGSSPPSVDGLASVAIWANCLVVMTPLTSPPPQFLCLLYALFQLTLGWMGFHFWHWGVCRHWEFLIRVYLCPGPKLQGLPALPILGIFFVLAILEKKASQSEARAALQESYDICCELISMSFFENDYKRF